MRKTLIGILTILLIILIGFIGFNSITIGNLHILGVKELGQENKKLDSQIEQASKLNSTDYTKALSDIENSTKQYKLAKSDYDELAAVSSSGDVTSASQIQKYEIEYLWTKIGTHANAEGVQLKMDVSANSTSAATGYYDLDFSVTGDYVGITDFIYDIENDSSLGFKVENFKMEPFSGDQLQATFKCTNIAINIDPSEVTKNSDSQNKDGDDQNKDDQNSSDQNSDSKNEAASSDEITAEKAQ